MTQDQRALDARLGELALSTSGERRRVRNLVATGRWQAAEADATRLKRFLTRRQQRRLPNGPEAFQGQTVDLQGTSFLTEGAQVRRAVASVEVNDPQSNTLGTGFLISPRLLMTNQHVIRDAAAARTALITFDRELDERGRPRAITAFLLEPDLCAVFSPIDQLDYAVVALGQRLSGAAELADLGYCPISDRPDKHVIGMPINIIQHPLGLPKMIAVRNNLLTFRPDAGRTLLYETDTETGSSGSPVFNDDWEVVALHHWGQPFLESTGVPADAPVNEGVRISAIYADLRQRAEQLRPAERALIEEALALDRQSQDNGGGGRQLAPPRRAFVPVAVPDDERESAIAKPSAEAPTRSLAPPQAPTSSGSSMTATASDQLHLTIPLHITLQVGSVASVSATVAPAPKPVTQADVPASAGRVLTRGPEVMRLDRNYANRPGYDPAFIPSQRIDLPKLSAALKSQVAPLRVEEHEAGNGVLKYQHFSVVMHKARRMAIYTATNIDGAAYLAIDRKTGEPAAEGETWYLDPRISRSFFLDQSFYSDWSTYFDRGHLTRRTDPAWGSAAEAKRANADTFHFTNCSPQHFRFNQTAEFWQGAERYVLENGVLQAESQKRLCVFQGPIFNDQIDRFADDVQIPSSFFKVVVWRGAEHVKAVGLVVDQTNLLDEQRHSLGQPRDLAQVDVAQWRVGLSAIERRTGLDFGDAVRKADTINQNKQPTVGEEALHPILRFADILG